VKEYYIQLSEIIRQYIEGRYFLDALEMTTTQLLEKMNQEQINADAIQMMREFLDACDLVKFAKYIPSDEETQIVTQLAFDFVQETKLVISEPTEESATSETSESEEKKAEPVPAAEPQLVEDEGR